MTYYSSLLFILRSKGQSSVELTLELSAGCWSTLTHSNTHHTRQKTSVFCVATLYTFSSVQMMNFWVSLRNNIWDWLHICFKFVLIQNYTKKYIYTYYNTNTFTNIQANWMTWHNSRSVFVHKKVVNRNLHRTEPKKLRLSEPKLHTRWTGFQQAPPVPDEKAKAKPHKQQTMTISAIIASSVIFQYNNLSSTFSFFWSKDG